MMTFSAIRGAQIIDVTKDCEFQWAESPNSITQGTFPDSLLTPDLNDFLECEVILNGASAKPILEVKMNKAGWYWATGVFGVGENIDANHTAYKCLYSYTLLNAVHSIGSTSATKLGGFNSSEFNTILSLTASFPFGYMDAIRFRWYIGGQGTYRIRFHQIRIFKIIA